MAIAVQGMYFDEVVHERSLTGVQVSLYAVTVRFAVALRDNCIFDCLVEYVVGAPAEYFFRPVIPAGNVSIKVHLHHGIDRGFEKSFQLGVLCEDDFFLLAQIDFERLQPFLEQGGFLCRFLERIFVRHVYKFAWIQV